MATVRITGNWPHFLKKEWLGAPAIDADGRIERSLHMPEEAFRAIERQIAGGASEGLAVIAGGVRFEWLLDGAPRKVPPPARAGALERLRPLLPEIDGLARGEMDGSGRQAAVIRLLAGIMAALLRSADDDAKTGSGCGQAPRPHPCRSEAC